MDLPVANQLNSAAAAIANPRGIFRRRRPELFQNPAENVACVNTNGQAFPLGIVLKEGQILLTSTAGAREWNILSVLEWASIAHLRAAATQRFRSSLTSTGMIVMLEANRPPRAPRCHLSMRGFDPWSRKNRVNRFARLLAMLSVATVVLGLESSTAKAGKVTVRDGRVLEGRLAPIPSMSADPHGVNDGAKPILLVDDDLRRTFVPQRLVEEVHEGASESFERFNVWQKVASAGNPVVSVGAFQPTSAWNEFGRRTVVMRIGDKTVDIIQGIVEINPRYTRAVALSGYKWEQRIATSAIHPDTLRKILERTIDKNNLEHRLRLVQFFVQSERYEDARQELAQVVKDFPEAKAQHGRVLRDATQLSARTLLAELRTRERAGQFRLVYQILNKFPSDGVAGETLQEVAELLRQQQQVHGQGKAVLEQFDAHLTEFAKANSVQAAELQPIREEIFRELTVHTLDRMAAYQQFSADPQTGLDQKIALAISGWVLGPKSATDNLSTALSLYQVREVIREYMNAELKLDRELLLRKIATLEGSTAPQVALLLAHMKPPKRTDPSENGDFAISIPGGEGRPPLNYLVQLPPEYDPYRRYPAVVTLHGGNTQPKMQLDWWAGSPDEKGIRHGQAMRHGYIVIAPAWGELHQTTYQYSLREHLAVLDALRDACRRFSIDTDRVFLSGHMMGANAAWDIGLAHPDLWAGVIPISGVCDRICNLYWENASNLPFYVINGEFAGDSTARNALSLDRYMRRGYPVTSVEFLGRGAEEFSDEILRLLDWMARYRRDFFPRQFATSTLREWDNYFWWAEVIDMPKAALIDPGQWPPRRGTRAVTFEGKILENNSILFKGGGGRLAIWLSPEIVNFDQQVRISVNGRTTLVDVKPDVGVLLEDARTRGDRQHPFWSRVILGGREGVIVGLK